MSAIILIHWLSALRSRGSLTIASIGCPALGEAILEAAFPTLIKTLGECSNG
jgi:hypothetical protein